MEASDLLTVAGASLEACEFCREGRKFHVKVTPDTPLYVWSPLPPPGSRVGTPLGALTKAGDEVESSPGAAPEVAKKTEGEQAEDEEEKQQGEEECFFFCKFFRRNNKAMFRLLACLYAQTLEIKVIPV